MSREYHEVRAYGLVWSVEVNMQHRDEPQVLAVQAQGDIAEFLLKDVLDELEYQLKEEAS